MPGHLEKKRKKFLKEFPGKQSFCEDDARGPQRLLTCVVQVSPGTHDGFLRFTQISQSLVELVDGFLCFRAHSPKFRVACGILDITQITNKILAGVWSKHFSQTSSCTSEFKLKEHVACHMLQSITITTVIATKSIKFFTFLNITTQILINGPSFGQFFPFFVTKRGFCGASLNVAVKATSKFDLRQDPPLRLF